MGSRGASPEQGRGEVLRILREELLPVFGHLGDMRSRAVTRFKIAQVALQRQDIPGAVESLQSAWQDRVSLDSFELLGHVRLLVGQLALAAGTHEPARHLLTASAQAFRKLGQIGLAEQAEAMLAQVPEGE